MVERIGIRLCSWYLLFFMYTQIIYYEDKVLWNSSTVFIFNFMVLVFSFLFLALILFCSLFYMRFWFCFIIRKLKKGSPFVWRKYLFLDQMKTNKGQGKANFRLLKLYDNILYAFKCYQIKFDFDTLLLI